MSVQLIPYLTFGAECREALTFYASVLGGSPTFYTFGEYVPEMAGDERIMHGDLLTDAGLRLMASDDPMSTETPAGGDVTLSLHSADASLLQTYFDGLSEGGQVRLPLEMQSWGNIYGEFSDRFGKRWSVLVSE